MNPSESNKSDSDSDSDEQKKGRQVFQEKNRGVTPSVGAPGVTHPSDATGHSDDMSRHVMVSHIHTLHTVR